MKRIAKLLLVAALAALLAPTAQAAEYQLAVAGRQVTDANKDDILGDGGSVRFSLSGTNGTLTLSNAAITSGLGDYVLSDFFRGLAGIALADNFALTIVLEGANRVESASFLTGIVTVSPLTITGGGSLSLVPGEGFGIDARDDLTIDGATVSDIGSRGGGIECGGTLTITNANVTASNRDSHNGIECKRLSIGGASRLEAITAGTGDKVGKKSALWFKNGIEIGDGLVVLEPSPYWIDDNTIHAEGDSGRDGALRVVIGPPVAYPLWVGGTQVTSANAANILGDGTASFVGTATNGTLFLADATITGAYSFGGSAPPYTAAVYADFDFDLEIALSGSNRVVNTNGTSWGCYPRGNLVIAGDGVLDVEAGTEGIFVSGSLLVRDATVVVDCHSASALGARGIAISNAVVTAVSEGNGPAIESSGDLVIADSTVVSTGIDCSIESFDGSIRISGASRVTAETLQENGNALFAEDGDVVLEGDNGIVAPAGGWVGEHDTSFYAVRAVLDPATGAPATRVVIDTLPPPAITNVVATPDATEGTVELSFFVENDPAAGRPAWNRPVLVVTATDHETGSNYVSAASALSGQTDAAPGTHLVTWDYGAQGVRLDSASVTFAVSYLVMPDWCVVDLSGGKDATRHPVSYLDAPPAGGFDNDAFKTANLALRLVSPGSFSMGSSRDEDNKPHRVTLTNAYYIAVFEATQRQWELVTGKRPSFFKSDAHYATRPVEQVSYDMIRGADAGAGWPASRAVDGDSFLGKLRARTGVGAFDLPTEAQWEYACRAGTSTDYNSGKRMLNENQDANMGEVGRYLYNGGTDGLGKPDCTPDAGTAAVGSYEPNRWGLYDFHGNACEWCLDWSGDLANSANEPVGAPSGTSRVMRGGGWNGIASFCISSRRGSFAPSVSSSNIGFRLARTISGDTAAERAGEAASGAERAGTVCAGEAEAVEVIPRFAVTVEGGSTTNTTARAGETVTVVANAPEEGKAFVEWSPDDAMDLSFATAAATTTTFAMPARAVTVTAVFKEIQIDSIPDQEWTGGPVEPEFRSDTVKFEGTDMVLLPGTDYTVSYTNNVDPGTATATVTMAPPRTGHASVTFQILPPPEPPAVSNVVARQRWPWNGYVDVDYEVGGTTTGLVTRISFAEQGGAGRSWVASNFLAGAEPSAAPGPHRATWDTAADGATNVVAAEVVATVALVREEPIVYNEFLYEIGGESAWSVPHPLYGKDRDGKYLGYYYLNSEFKFRPNAGDWNGDYEFAGEGRIADNGGANCPAPEPSFYRIQVDLAEGTYALEAVRSITMVGTHNSWNVSDLATHMSFDLEEGCWTIDYTFAEQTSLRFAMNDDWTVSWGGANGDASNYGDLTENNGKDLSVASGKYRIKLYLSREGSNRVAFVPKE